LSPKCFLRHLPSIDIEDFWDHSFSHENDEIRSQFGQKIIKSVDRETMFKAARTSAYLRESYLKEIEDREPEPYDIRNDPELVHKWYHIGWQQFKNDPLKFHEAKSYNQFLDVVRQIIGRYKHHV